MNILNGKNYKIQRQAFEEFLNLEDGPGSIFTVFEMRDGKTGRLINCTHNTTVLGGRIALLEEMFGLTRNKDQHLMINSSLGVPHSETDKVLNNYTHKRQVGYFMVGDGASSLETPGKFYTAKNYETKLYHPLPFRMVPLATDLSISEQEQYRLRKIVNINGVDYVAYYAKKFEPSSVILEYNSAQYKPIESHTVPVDEADSTHPLRGGSVLAYITFSISIEENELKEWFRITSNISKCAMSETGLVLAADLPNALDNNRSELAAAELFTKICSTSTSLSEDGSSRIITIRLFAK